MGITGKKKRMTLSCERKASMDNRLVRDSAPFLAMLCVICAFIAAFLLGCSSAQPSPGVITPTIAPTAQTTAARYWPTSGWRTSPPEEQGMDAQKLAQLLAAVEQQRLNLHSLLVIRNGYIVSETYFGSYKQDTRHESYSCTKSFVSTLVGIALDKAQIDRIDRRVVELFLKRTIANLDQRKRDMTLEDVLTMRSGLDWKEEDPSFVAMYRSRDWVQFMLDKPMAASPGTDFNYCSGCSHLLSAIVQETTGMKTRDYAEQYLFKPLGIADAKWETDASGIPIGGWGLQLIPRDLAKLGYLYLRNGQWDGKQIVSGQWVKRATEQHTRTDSDLGYGYQWWTYPSLDAYVALGRGGQTIFVIPRLDLIVVTTAEMSNHDPVFRLIEEYIVPAVRKNQ